MKIRPALKGRNKILDHKPVLPLQGVAILNTRSDSQGGALGWHVAAPSGRDSRSATSKAKRDGIPAWLFGLVCSFPVASHCRRTVRRVDAERAGERFHRGQ